MECAVDRGEATSGGQVRNQTDWCAASELIKTRQYERLTELLLEARGASERRGDTIQAQLLEAAHSICLACSQCRAEIAWHQQALKEAGHREQDLRGQIRTILDLASEPRSPLPQDVPEVPPSPPMVAPDSARPRFWGRIRSLLSLKSAALPCGSAPPTTISEVAPQPSLAIYCLGQFRVLQDDQNIEEWPSSRGKSIFKYLVAHHQLPIPKEVLMELFWPEAHPDAARNNLNVSIYGLRQALRKTHPDYLHVLFRDECYLLNPDMHTWVDAEEFVEHHETGQSLEQGGELIPALREYRVAESLYQGEFLEEDRYEDWLVPRRQRLQDDYLILLDRLSRLYLDQEDFAACAAACHKMLAVEPCREEAHRRLMRCYCRQGQPHLAIRQYHLCVEHLKEELDISPAKTTEVLHQQVRKGRRI
jgi:DNA-binding SARP family transcriptional activator